MIFCRNVILIFSALLNLMWSSIALSMEEERISLGINEKHTVTLSFEPSHLSIGNPDILDAKANASQKSIVFLGLGVGNSSVTVRDGTGRVRKVYIIEISDEPNRKSQSRAISR